MQSLRRAACSRLLAQWQGSSVGGSSLACGGALQQLQQQAGFAKKSESMDSRLQRVLRMLEPQEVTKVEVSEEDFQEATRRCGGPGVAGCSRRHCHCRLPPPLAACLCSAYVPHLRLRCPMMQSKGIQPAHDAGAPCVAG